MGTPMEFHEGWQEWLAENLMVGVPDEKLVVVAAAAGFGEEDVRRRIASLERDPLVRAGRAVAGRRHKMATLLDALAVQYRQSGAWSAVPVLERPSPSQFFDDWYFANRPVVLRGLMDGSKALELWSPQWLASEYGECEIEITAGREDDPWYEERVDHHRVRTTMADYVRDIRAHGPTNDRYLVAKNHLLAQPEFAGLLDHVPCPPGILDPTGVATRVKLWFGPAGTVTPLHHDATNILFGQVYGRKLVRLVSPFELERLGNRRECFSDVDLDHVDLARFPAMRDVQVTEVVLYPGEMVLLPIGWWHWVRSLDVAISLSCTNIAVSGGTVVWRYRSGGDAWHR
jgi:hypothetical protein